MATRSKKTATPAKSSHQSKAATANPVNFGFSDDKPFKRCGHCGDQKPTCRKEKRCVKDLI